MQEKSVVVSVAFMGGYSSKRYNYILHLKPGDDPQIGDLVAVEVGSETKLTKIKEIGTENRYPYGMTNDALGFISLADKRRREAEKKRREAIQRRLDQLAAQESRELIYERLAQNNPEAAQLLDELRALGA